MNKLAKDQLKGILKQISGIIDHFQEGNKYVIRFKDINARIKIVIYKINENGLVFERCE